MRLIHTQYFQHNKVSVCFGDSIKEIYRIPTKLEFNSIRPLTTSELNKRQKLKNH